VIHKDVESESMLLSPRSFNVLEVQTVQDKDLKNCQVYEDTKY